jgi:mono/diheme cytochrome c family protein
MPADAALVVAALSTGHKIGLAAVGIAFIVFALISSFVLPRRIPNFPGRYMGWYVTACVVFFVAMLSAVLVFGREEPEAKGEESPPAQTAPPTATTSEQPTTTAKTTTAKTTTSGGGGGEAKGDPVAGKAVFETAGCGGCHTLKAAGSTGNVGPNLDDLKPSEDKVVEQVTNGGGGMPPFKGQLSAKQIQDVAAFVFTSTHA